MYRTVLNSDKKNFTNILLIASPDGMTSAEPNRNNVPLPDGDADGAQRVALVRFVDVLARLEARRELQTMQQQREGSPDVLRIPIEAGQVFRGEAGHRSDLKPAGIPISFRPPD